MKAARASSITPVLPLDPVEDGPTVEVVRNPRHPCTHALVAAVPVPDANQSRTPLPVSGNVPTKRAALRLPLPRPLPARLRKVR